MSSELSDLYQEVVLDHGKRPRNFGPLEGATHRAEGLNPLCGDQITVQARLDGDVVREARFEGSGCAISKASASVMTGTVKGRSAAEVDRIFEDFHRLVLEQTGVSFSTRPHFGCPLDGETDRYLRISYSGIDTEEIDEGLGMLKAFLESRS